MFQKEANLQITRLVDQRSFTSNRFPSNFWFLVMLCTSLQEI